MDAIKADPEAMALIDEVSCSMCCLCVAVMLLLSACQRLTVLWSPWVLARHKRTMLSRASAEKHQAESDTGSMLRADC